jgi:hypothetical protein
MAAYVPVISIHFWGKTEKGVAGNHGLIVKKAKNTSGALGAGNKFICQLLGVIFTKQFTLHAHIFLNHILHGFIIKFLRAQNVYVRL